MKTNFDKLAKLFPEAASAIVKVRADNASGAMPKMRETFQECNNWPEAWVYIFRCAFLQCDDHLQFENDKIVCVVWPVPAFDDNLVEVLEKIANRIGPDQGLREIRLINTMVTEHGAEKLKTVLPNASIRFISREEARRDQTIEYINTRVKWIKKLHEEKSKGGTH